MEPKKTKKFQAKVNALIALIEDEIAKMPYQGDSETESQKIYLTNQLNQFQYAVNGVTEKDFKPTE